MQPTQSGKPRRRFALSPEMLEDRSLMTGGAGSMFAVMPATATAGKVSQVSFTIDPTHFTVPKGKFELGIDVTAASGSKAEPVILSVVQSNDKPAHLKHAVYNPKVQRSNTAAGSFTSAVLADVGFAKKNPTAAVTYTVDVMTQAGTSGKYLLGFYLPGDTNGDGTVNKTDVTKIKSQMGQTANNTTYSFDADTNRDGKISAADLQIAKQNMGVTTTINPTVSANLDTSNSPTLSPGTVKSSPVHYTGVVSPGATITYQGTNKGDLPVSTAANSSGKYSVYVPADTGENVYVVTTKDAFQQSISGAITPVSYLAPAMTTRAIPKNP